MDFKELKFNFVLLLNVISSGMFASYMIYYLYQKDVIMFLACAIGTFLAIGATNLTITKLVEINND